MMAARKSEGIMAENYVSISAPLRPYPPLDLIRRKLAVSQSVLNRHQVSFANELECEWDNITQMAYAFEDNKNLLLIYDEEDRLVSHEDGDHIKKQWPKSQLVKLRGNSHKNMIHSADMIQSVIDFLNQQANLLESN